MKWDVDNGNTEEGIPCLHRIYYTKFWSKLLQPDQQGKMYGKDLINETKAKREAYATQEVQETEVVELSSFQQVSRKL